MRAWPDFKTQFVDKETKIVTHIILKITILINKGPLNTYLIKMS